MGNRGITAIVVIGTAAALTAGCDRGGDRATERHSASASGRPPAAPTLSATPAGGPSAKQLRKALIGPPPGATTTGSGSGTLAQVLARMGRGQSPAVAAEAASCDRLGAAGLKRFGSAPAAFAEYGRGETVVLVLLVAVPAEAGRAVLGPVPAECRSTTARVDGQKITARVISDEAIRIGDGGRIMRVDQTNGGIRFRQYEVAFTGPRHLAVGVVIGPDVTRADAERLGRSIHRKAGATLR